MQGDQTAHVARELTRRLHARGFDVLFDHGTRGLDSADTLGKIVSWYGHELKRGTRLAFLDIAVVLRGTNDVFALVEIEETSVKPKVLLGDVLATLLGAGITFRRERHLNVGEWTTLIVLARSNARTDTQFTLHQRRIAFLEEKVNQLKLLLRTLDASSLASVGPIKMGLFRDASELEQTLVSWIEGALPKVERS
jgi:hypothetical protein